MSKLRKNFELFCYRNKDRGIPNLMLWIGAATLLVYIFSFFNVGNTFVSALEFDRSKILQGQIWRIFTWVFVPEGSSYFIFEIIMLFFYYQIGKAIEASWGTLKFNLFYLCGVLLILMIEFLFNYSATGITLNISLILAFATLYPENQVLLFFIIPLKMKYLAWFYLGITILEILINVISVFPSVIGMVGSILVILVPLLNYFLFFGKDVRRVLPGSGCHNGKNTYQAGSYTTHVHTQYGRKQPAHETASPRPSYRHKCTVCGKTDTDYPNLEFRYCSKCSGYYCYCIDHINNHPHIL